MPDSRFAIYEHHNATAQGNLEGIRGLSDALEDAKGWLDNAKAQTRAVCKGEG
jgi:hypothetical protein